MFAGCLQIIRAHWHLIRVEGVGYLQIIRAENTDVCSSYGLCLQAVTGIVPTVPAIVFSGGFGVAYRSSLGCGDFRARIDQSFGNL